MNEKGRSLREGDEPHRLLGHLDRHRALVHAVQGNGRRPGGGRALRGHLDRLTLRQAVDAKAGRLSEAMAHPLHLWERTSGIVVLPGGVVKTQLMEVFVRRDGRWLIGQGMAAVIESA